MQHAASKDSAATKKNGLTNFDGSGSVHKSEIQDFFFFNEWDEDELTQTDSQH